MVDFLSVVWSLQAIINTVITVSEKDKSFSNI